MPEFHVINFTMVRFDPDNWQLLMPPSAEGGLFTYMMIKEVGFLQVVVQGPVFPLMTYTYEVPQLPNGDKTLVYIHNHVILLPGKCVRQECGNTLSCG